MVSDCFMRLTLPRSSVAKGAPSIGKTVSAEYIAKGVDINSLVVQKLDDAITVLRPVHTQCGRHDVFGAEHARFDAAFCRSDFKIDRFCLCEASASRSLD